MSTGPLPPTPELFCAERTRLDDEPIYGTATGVKVWFLLEYRQPWRTKATADNELPVPVQSFLSNHLANIPQSRLLFIKQQNDQRENLRFFIVKTDEVAPLILAFDLAAYEDLLALDMAAAAAGQEAYAGQEARGRFVREDPLFLVCTNGKRDKCCARFGRPVYEALREGQDEATWQSSHIGGHRYAPNVLFLPHSVNYGLFTPEEAQAAQDAYLRGKISDLARYRGRTYHAPHVQAADYFLRQRLQYHDLNGIHLHAVKPLEKDNWLVQFFVSKTEASHQLWVERQMTAQKQLVSCSTPAEKAVPRYRLVEHSRIL